MEEVVAIVMREIRVDEFIAALFQSSKAFRIRLLNLRNLPWRKPFRPYLSVSFGVSIETKMQEGVKAKVVLSPFAAETSDLRKLMNIRAQRYRLEPRPDAVF
jgi:hypothetical protein